LQGSLEKANFILRFSGFCQHSAGIAPNKPLRPEKARMGQVVPEKWSYFLLVYTAFMLYHKHVTGRELIRLLKSDNWKLDRIKGSNNVMKKGNRTISVPVHGKKDLPKGTFNAIMKEAGLR